MPKMKTRRGAAKRFTVTGRGKIRRGKAFKRHMLSCKNRKRKRGLRHATTVSGVEQRRMRRLIPYM
jgi:large subunit ribosomal protein L35